jgi:acyl carrier protein phosphodiesterase
MMNYLAHAYLSYKHPQVLVGNMISDFVKGKAQFRYERLIHVGIRLHRSIDAFTDEHPATHRAKEVFRSYYRLYSGAIVDVLYDHFLANDPAIFNNENPLQSFSEETYSVLEAYAVHLPERFVVLLPYMKTQNWLYNYQYRLGIERSLKGLVRRASYLSDSAPAFALFNEHYSFLQECYNDFIEDVKNHAKEQMHILL